MPTVVGKDDKHVHRCTCKNCASILEYTKNEVDEVNGKDYYGGSDGYEYINCPTCGKRVILRSW